DKAAAEKGAVKTPSGAIVTTLKAGTGPSPTASDKVKVHYQGTLMDGTVFDSSIQRGEPITFPLSGVIKCWGEGVQQMKVGGKSRLVCPADTAYGDRGAPPKIKPGATLVFEVELLEIVKEALVGAVGITVRASRPHVAAQRLNRVAEPASTEAQVQADAKRYTELEQRRPSQG